MAKKTEAPKTVLERVYNVPLRKEYQKAPNWRRTPKAVKALQQFIQKHMKSNDVVISRYANLHLWKHGIKNPPHHIKVNAIKNDKGKVTVDLVDLPGKAKREQAKLKDLDKKKETKKALEKSAETTKLEKKASDTKETKAEEKIEDAKKDKEEKAKEIQKEEIKELKKELPKQQAPKQAPQPKQVEQRPTAPKSQ